MTGGAHTAGQFAAALELLTQQLRLAVYAERGRRGMSLRAAAGELGTHASEVHRFEVGEVANPTVDTIRRFVDWLSYSERQPGKVRR